MLRVVLDTNVFLVGLLPKHKYGWVMRELINSSYELCVSTDIMMEYNEKMQEKYGVPFTKVLLDDLTNFKNVIRISPFYQWRLIVKDPDDNKFVDCAIAGHADFIVSHDNDFNILDQIKFPKVKVIRLEAFKSLLNLEK